MTDDSLDSVFAFAEKAFIRMQAGEVLTRCLEVSSVNPMHKLVESLVLAGPESLDVFREILAETTLRKSQVQEDIDQVLNGLKTNLDSYGIRFHGVSKPATVAHMKPSRFLGVLRAQGILEEETQATCMQLWRDARDLVSSLNLHYNLLRDVETYLNDWMWDVLYQSARQGNEYFT
ncbi:MAG TPA: hypothetical protein VMT46_17960 [Anaerolineaceae bacterium]|nr:hypothetical protein [Anaerolineaceae bacterium]